MRVHVHGRRAVAGAGAGPRAAAWGARRRAPGAGTAAGDGGGRGGPPPRAGWWGAFGGEEPEPEPEPERFDWRPAGGFTMGAGLAVGDLSRKFNTDDLLCFVLCILIPCLGVYFDRKKVDKYFFASLVGMFLGYVPGVLLALMFVFGNVRF